jgi:hypothetical protein
MESEGEEGRGREREREGEKAFNCHLRYKHISHSIWLISGRANMLWLTMHQDLLECMLLQIILKENINTNKYLVVT